MRKALGRGLDALIPGAGKLAAQSEPESGPSTNPSTVDIPIAQIRPNPRQPRAEFDDNALTELADSIRVQGVLQPVVVRRMPDGAFELIAGERRLRAAQRAGLEKVPATMREASDIESLELALVENLQRDDLSPLEEASAYQRLMEEFGHTQEEIAGRVGKSRPNIANTLRLLKLPEAIKRDLASGKLTAGHARVLLSVDGADAQLRAARQIQARRLSVREAEKIVATRREKAAIPQARDLHRQALEQELSAALGTRVRVQPRGRGGRIEIEYYSNEELAGLCDRLRRPAR